jgi:hypothetical protein
MECSSDRKTSRLSDRVVGTRYHHNVVAKTGIHRSRNSGLCDRGQLKTSKGSSHWIACTCDCCHRTDKRLRSLANDYYRVAVYSVKSRKLRNWLWLVRAVRYWWLKVVIRSARRTRIYMRGWSWWYTSGFSYVSLLLILMFDRHRPT